MAVDIFLKIPGITGESVVKDHIGAIEILRFNFGVQRAIEKDAGASYGLAKGELSFDDISVTKRIDSATPMLMQKCADAKKGDYAFDTVTLTCRKAGGTQVSYLTIELKNCCISRWYSGEIEDDFFIEVVDFSFTKINIDYCEQKSDGSLEAKKPGTFDLIAVKS